MLVIALATMFGCGGNASPAVTVPPPPLPLAPVPPPPAPVTEPAKPVAVASAIQHVVIVVLENRGFNDVIGSAAMPYLNSLATKYALATNYYANGVESLPNYFMLTVGDTVATDASFGGTVHIDNVVRRLLAAGKTWKAYAESIPSVGYLGGDAPPYMKIHNPFEYLEDVQSDPAQAANMVPVEQFASDLAADKLPNYSFIIPNNYSNSHDCAPTLPNCDTATVLKYADDWLRTHLEPLLQSKTWNSTLLLLTFDEGGIGDVTHGGGHIATIIAGPKVNAGYKIDALLQHESMLRLSLKALGVNTYPNKAAGAPDVDTAFAGPLP